MDIILTSSSTETEKILVVKPNAIVLKEPTLDQISSLCKIGYLPPDLEHFCGEFVMAKTDLPINFPPVEQIRHVLAEIGGSASSFHEVFKWFSNQSMDILTAFGFLQEGEEDMYAFHTQVLSMETRHAQNIYLDRLAEEQENGAMFQCTDI